AVIGVVLWIGLVSRLPSRNLIVTGFFIGLVILQALAPFQFSSIARPFGWMPFRSFLNGYNGFGVPSFLEKTFTYGCLVWLLGRIGIPWVQATISGAVFVFGLRLAQVYLPGRSAEITDVVLLVSVAIIMRLMAEPRSDSV